MARFGRFVAASVLALTAVPAAAATMRPTTRPAARVRLATVETGELREISGCAVSRRTPSRVWLHNDSGDGPRLHWLDLSTHERGAVEVRGARARDWEDMAPAPSGGLVVADIGDNAGGREGVVLYRLAEPAPRAVTADAIPEPLVYEDGPHDAEALVVDPGDGTAYVITKEPGGRAGVYRADGAVLRRVGTVRITGEVGFVPNLVTAADALPDGSGVVLRTNQKGYVVGRPNGKPFAAAFAATPRPFRLPPMLQPEAMCVTADGRSVVTTSESVGSPVVTFAVALPRAG